MLVRGADIYTPIRINVAGFQRPDDLAIFGKKIAISWPRGRL